MYDMNKAIVRRAIEEGMNRHDTSVLAEIYPNCVYHSPITGDLRGEAYREFLASMLIAFPDARGIVLDQIAEGEKVMTRWSFTGTHKGKFMGIPSTGRRVTATGMCMDRVVDGKIVEEWEEWDSLGLMRQLGVVPEAKTGDLVAA